MMQDGQTDNVVTSAQRRPDRSVDVTLGRSIRRRRLVLGMTQQALGEASQVCYQQIQKYEDGASRITVARLILLARALRCTPSSLMHALEPDDADVIEISDAEGLLEAPGATVVLDAYRKMAPQERRALAALLREMAKRPLVSMAN